MRSFAPVWLVVCASIAFYKFNQGSTGTGLYWSILALITAVSVSKM
ncbi:hypothetical protein [Lacrimispora sp.]|nr:hypothetical protein [Lacrimispora sp.]